MALEALPEQLDRLTPPIYGPYEYARSLLKPTDYVLDVGCGNGKVSEFLATVAAAVDGIEPAENRARIARRRLNHVSTIPAGEPDASLRESYDMITFFDVLEHLPDPSIVLEWARSKLSPNGRVLASIPNSAHYSFRLKILRGDWSMADWGLFDRTHLRFFDLRSMRLLAPAAMVDTQTCFAPNSSNPLIHLGLKMHPNLFALHAVMEWVET